MSYRLTLSPPLEEGGKKRTVTELSPATAVTWRGSPGRVLVVAAEAEDMRKNDDRSATTVTRKMIFDFMTLGRSSQYSCSRQTFTPLQFFARLLLSSPIVVYSSEVV